MPNSAQSNSLFSGETNISPELSGAAYGNIEKHLSRKSREKTEKKSNLRANNGRKAVFISIFADENLEFYIENIQYPSDMVLQLPYEAKNILILYSERKREIVGLSARSNIQWLLRTQYPEADYAKCPSYHCHKKLEYADGATRMSTLIVPCYESKGVYTSLAEETRHKNYRPVISSCDGQPELRSTKKTHAKHIQSRAVDFGIIAGFLTQLASTTPCKETKGEKK